MNDQWTKDSDNDGIPDVIEDAIDEAKASFASRTFTKRNLYLSIIIGAIIAGYGLFAYMYLSLRDEKIAIQNQYDWFKSEQEIEINKAKIAERYEKYKNLKLDNKELSIVLNDKKNNVDKLHTVLINKPYEDDNEDEIHQLNTDQLKSMFDDIGYPTK